MNDKIKVRLLRHATLVIEINGRKLLIDPMLSPKDHLDPVQNCGNDIRFPMVELPIETMELRNLLHKIDAVVVTHTHRDHWDIIAQELINRNKTIFCQPADSEKIKGQGFKNVQPIDSTFTYQGLTIKRTNGQHGTGEIGEKMGLVSGFVFIYDDECIYLTGDTIWCKEVEDVLLEFKPKTTILNAGGARFLTGDPITMTPDDIMRVHETLPETTIIAVHMDTVNHCFVKRTDIRASLKDKISDSVLLIPDDGQTIMIKD